MADDKKIRRQNRKAEKLLLKLLKDKSFVKIGVLGKPDQKGSAKASDVKKVSTKDGSKDSPDGTTLVDIAVIHEFGTSKIPPRSFLRSTFAENKKKIPKVYLGLAKRAIKKKDYDPKDVLKLMGAWMAGQVRQTFTKNDWPPLKDPTRGGKNKEGGATPLVDTGQLRASISYQVIEDQNSGQSTAGAE
jgi:HK97 gp10 family phage protein